MGEFLDRAEGERILAILERGMTADRRKPLVHLDQNPLYRFVQTKEFNRYEIDPAVEEMFVLLKRNGYGDTHVAKTEEDFRGRIGKNLTGGDPSWTAALDKNDLDKTMYLINDRQRKGVNGPHFMAERICDGTFHAILSRALELGDNCKPAYKPQNIWNVPVPRF